MLQGVYRSEVFEGSFRCDHQPGDKGIACGIVYFGAIAIAIIGLVELAMFIL